MDTNLLVKINPKQKLPKQRRTSHLCETTLREDCSGLIFQDIFCPDGVYAAPNNFYQQNTISIESNRPSCKNLRNWEISNRTRFESRLFLCSSTLSLPLSRTSLQAKAVEEKRGAEKEGGEDASTNLLLNTKPPNCLEK